MNCPTYDFTGYTPDELRTMIEAQMGQFDAWSAVLMGARSHKRRADASQSAIEALDMAEQCALELERRA